MHTYQSGHPPFSHISMVRAIMSFSREHMFQDFKVKCYNFKQTHLVSNTSLGSNTQRNVKCVCDITDTDIKNIVGSAKCVIFAAIQENQITDSVAKRIEKWLNDSNIHNKFTNFCPATNGWWHMEIMGAILFNDCYCGQILQTEGPSFLS